MVISGGVIWNGVSYSGNLHRISDNSRARIVVPVVRGIAIHYFPLLQLLKGRGFSAVGYVYNFCGVAVPVLRK